MQTLYIFGNGFDIAHGIRTPYFAFRDFLKENHESFLTTLEGMYYIQPLDDTEPWYTKAAQERWDKSVINDLWWSFEEKIGHPDVEGMYDAAHSMVDTMPTEGIIDTMNVYWREQYGFVDKLQKYVLEWLQTIDTSKAVCKKDSLVNNKQDLFMSFNYTDTLEKAYGINHVFQEYRHVVSYLLLWDMAISILLIRIEGKQKRRRRNMLNGMKVYAMQLPIFVSRCTKIRIK